MTTKIVVVEDERIVALNLQQRLQRLGYEVSAIASCAEQAIFFVGRDNPDIVLMDIHIDGDVDGIDAARHIMELFQSTIIYLTAYSEEGTLVRARATKPYGYLLKPFSERELHATIQMALERRNAEQTLSKSEARLRLALDAAQMAAWELDADTQEMVYTDTADSIFGFSGGALSHSLADLLALVYHEDRHSVNEALQKTMADTLACAIEFRYVQRDNSMRWLYLQGKVFALAPGDNNLHVIGVVQDITERKAIDARLHQAATVFEATQDGILILDTERRVIAANRSFETITGYAGDELIGRLPYLLQSELQRHKYAQELDAALISGGQWRREVRSRRRDGSEFPILMTVAGVRNTRQQLTHYVLVVADLTAVRNVEDRLQYLAHHDPLTDLPNRLLTAERLNHALKRGKRRHERIAVLFVDLDHFKWINDTLGHAAGDQLLAEVARRMKTCIRDDDTVGRFGGDEFLVLLDPVEHVEDIATVAQKIIDCIYAPMSIADRDLEIACSIGISLFPDDGVTAEFLIRAADTAMYAAKENGRRSYQFYAPAMTAKAMRQLAFGRDLRRGFAAHELLLHYQPQFSMQTHTVVGVEALLRWQHGQQGLLGAESIIAVAEENGLIVDIGEWVVRSVCRQICLWRDSGLTPPRVAINVSASQLQHTRFLPMLKQVLLQMALNPQLLEIEITEGTLQSGADNIATLQALGELGISLAVDDFGSGSFSLGVLKKLPIQRIKIDRVFIAAIPDNPNDIAVAEAIIAMAHRFDLRVTAEGIETRQQEQLLRERGCDEAQGYWYAKPMSAAAIGDLFAAR